MGGGTQLFEEAHFRIMTNTLKFHLKVWEGEHLHLVSKAVDSEAKKPPRLQIMAEK